MSAKPDYELVAPRARERMNDVADKIAKANPVALFNSLETDGKAKLPGMEDFELSESDVEFSFASSQPNLVVSENYGIVVALDTSRDDELIAQGTVRDLARNLQALRKEKGFNPTDVLEVAVIAGLTPQLVEMLKPKVSELAFLVRVKSVSLPTEKPPESKDWKKVEMDFGEVVMNIS